MRRLYTYVAIRLAMLALAIIFDNSVTPDTLNTR